MLWVIYFFCNVLHIQAIPTYSMIGNATIGHMKLWGLLAQVWFENLSHDIFLIGMSDTQKIAYKIPAHI